MRESFFPRWVFSPSIESIDGKVITIPTKTANMPHPQATFRCKEKRIAVSGNCATLNDRLEIYRE
jgi:hypothetical protein